MKINNKFGSIWDELPNYERDVPRNSEEVTDFYEAAGSSVHKSLMTTWDNHNELMKKSAELRKIYNDKKFIEQKIIEHREEQRRIMEEASLERIKESQMFKN